MLKESDLTLANCRNNSIPTSMFFEDFENIEYSERIKVVKICKSCPIKKGCLEYAMSHKETYGLWGGKFFKKGDIVDIKTIRRPRNKKSGE